ncbi:NUDIX domain-containing protein [Puteibacter caeruleilacunae]|nr:NUDIX domain-containing protein [Puteibacter caeruleilacunae]
MMKTIENRYDGIIVDNTTLPKSKHEFKDDIIRLLESISDKQLLWVKIPIDKSEFIPVLTDLDFEFHHCDERNLMLVRKLNANSFIPTSKNYILGVGAVVFNEGKLLVVKDRFSMGYKLPGGHVDKDEQIKEAVKREVYEETGVNIEFESIMNIGHFRNGQFGESNLYIVCTAKAISETIAINDTSEIADAQWVDVEEYLESEDANNYNKSVVRAAYSNQELKLTDQKIKLRVTGGEVFF